MLESGRGTRPAFAAAAKMAAAKIGGWPRRKRHARSSGTSAVAGKAVPAHIGFSGLRVWVQD